MISIDHRIKVYYRDVDQMGIVYNTRYLEYFEESRTELLKSIGLSVTKIEEAGIGFQLSLVTASIIMVQILNKN